MVAMLWMQQIVSKKRLFADVPQKLKQTVRELLIEKGRTEFISV